MDYGVDIWSVPEKNGLFGRAEAFLIVAIKYNKYVE